MITSLAPPKVIFMFDKKISLKRSKSLASSWRVDNGYQGKGGVVIVFAEKVQGWVNELRDPNHWCPGCFAFDESLNTWLTVGGNNQDGAKEWKEFKSEYA